MINKIDNKLYELCCDNCEFVEQGLDDFMSAVNFKKENGWASIKKDGEWTELCPDCKPI